MSSDRKAARHAYEAPRMIPVGSIIDRTGVCSTGCGFDNDANTAWYKGCGTEVEAV